MPEICTNCKEEVTKNYCPNCGQPKVLPRIDGKHLLQEFRFALNFEKGFLFTVKELALRPGKSIKSFLYEDRRRMVRPVVFLILTSIIYSVLNNLLHFEVSYDSLAGKNGSTSMKMMSWVQANYGYSNIIMAVFIGLWTRLFFHDRKVNLFEILIVLCYAMGMGMLIYSAFGLTQGLTSYNLMQIAAFFGFGYATWAIGQFFGKDSAMSYVNAFLAYMLGLVSFTFAALLIGIAIDVLF